MLIALGTRFSRCLHAHGKVLRLGSFLFNSGVVLLFGGSALEVSVVYPSAVWLPVPGSRCGDIQHGNLLFLLDFDVSEPLDCFLFLFLLLVFFDS